jgi:hypothetical protein
MQEAHVKPCGALGRIQEEHGIPLRLHNLVHGAGQRDVHDRQTEVIPKAACLSPT